MTHPVAQSVWRNLKYILGVAGWIAHIVASVLTSSVHLLVYGPTDNLEQTRPTGSPRVNSETSATPTQLTRYKKTGGAADGAGNDYEHKMLTLVFLRMLATGHEFQLASNMEAAEKFDDIVMRYRELPDEDWNSIFVQLKHKKNMKKLITKPELLGLSGDFSIVKYCDSYEDMKLSEELNSFGSFNDHKIIIFTNASINDSLVCKVESDWLLDTGGKAVSFKAGGEVSQGLCEWVDIKEALTQLHGQVEAKSEMEVRRKIEDALKNMKFNNKVVASFKDELLKTPTIAKLKTLLTKLETVKDKDTYSSFLENIQFYTNQAHESKLDAKIKEEMGKVWKCSLDLEADAMLHVLQAKVKSWWQKDNFYLTQDSPLWLDIVKSRTETLSNSTVELFPKLEMEFEESSLQTLIDGINAMSGVGGILNVRVDSRSAASSLRVHQALAKFRPNEIVVHVNMTALLEREDDVLSAWDSPWCRILVVECDNEINQSQAARIGEKVIEIIGKESENKLLVLIAPKEHQLNVRLYDTTDSYTRFNENFVWSDLTEKGKKNILTNRLEINGTRTTLTLSDLVSDGTGFFNKVDLEVISQFIQNDISCGKVLREVGKFFVNRRLKKSADGVPFAINCLRDVREKVALLVAEPGMGKSTLITHLANSAKKEDPEAWIVHITLNDCVQFLQEINLDQFTEQSVKRFLEQAAFKSANSFEKLLLGALMHKLVVFVDGVDEVCPQYERQVFKLLSYLKDMKLSRLWVASRPVFQTKLEEALDIKSYHLEAFLVGDRKDFFNKVWKAKDPSASSEKCSDLTESLLRMLNDSLGKDNPILGVPLMAVMIAEIFQERLFSENGQINAFKKDDTLDVMELYRIFIKKKFDVYCVEKKKTSNRELAANIDDEETVFKQTIHHHRLAALRLLFSREEIAGLQFEGKVLQSFDQDLATYLKDVSEGREKLGIIDNVIDGSPHFVHRSFAEYFVATWLALYFKENKRFIERIIFDPAYKLVSEMFNRALAVDHPLHKAVSNRDLEATMSYLNSESNDTHVNEVDAGGRTALHLALLLSGTDSHPDRAAIVQYLIQNRNTRLDVADEVLGWSPLHYAECFKSWKTLQSMLEKVGSSMNLIPKVLVPKPDQQLMLDAARDCNLLFVSYMVEVRGGDLNCKGTQGETMIHIAAEREHVAILKYLHNMGQTSTGLLLNSANNKGLTAFQETAQRGAYQLMEVFLLELTGLLSVNSSSQASAVALNASLLCAAFAGSLESVQHLLEMGASIRHQDSKGHTAAWLAWHRGHYEVMELLLLRGSDDGDSRLHGACQKDELEIVTSILCEGGDLEAKGFQGRTPLMAAAMTNSLACMELLLEKGAKVEGRDQDGNTALHKAGHQHALALLLRFGARATTTNNKGETLLHHASIDRKLDAGDLDSVKYILNTFNRDREGVSKDHFINMKDEKKSTFLHYLAKNGPSEIITYIMSQGGDQMQQNNDNSISLNVAAFHKQPDTVSVLLSAIKGPRAAAVNMGNIYGYTVVMSGAMGGCVKSVQLLVEAGGKLGLKSDAGWTALMLAASRNHVSVVRYMLKAFDSKREGMSLQDYIYTKDRDGRHSLQWAINSHECRNEIARYLQ